MSRILAFMLLCACALPRTDAPEEFSTCDGDDGYDIHISDSDSASPSVWVEGDTLSVMARYSGGCEDHLFSICWPDGAFLESDPVQVDLEIWHGGRRDMCDASFTGSLNFDLTPLKEEWKEAYGDGPGTIVINVAGASESAEYVFD